MVSDLMLRTAPPAMNDDRASDALALAAAALEAALREGVTEAEALVMAEDSALTRFANSEIHQNVAETNVVINLRVVVGKRVGVASSDGRTRTACGGSRRTRPPSPGSPRSSTTGGGLPSPDDGEGPARELAAGFSRADRLGDPGVPR
jgi:hypothetical protein